MLKRSREPGLIRIIQERIKQIITENELQPGDLLPPEGQLAEDLGVSRGSVREAVKSLESLGIVESRHGEGVGVREFNFDSVLDFLSFGLAFQPARASEILQIREWLEESAVVAVTPLIDQAQLDQIEKLLVVWEKKAAAGESTSDEDRSFHRMLYSPLGNASLLSLIDIFWVVYNALAIRKVPEDRDPLLTVQAHRELFEAVCHRDAPLARQRLSEHFRSIELRFKQGLESGAGKNAASNATVTE
ncbi:FadR/GntR family transcriptional regulator [Propionivibrio soli]|uniref:FadR/GntR family transcriptional regulator n=1 Tax=Propionivibrio soli TaxID=2976531 RepID=UPI0021E73D7E|nr:FadR/GntR family transcriptional regulator [Propionivibrio soli]